MSEITPLLILAIILLVMLLMVVVYFDAFERGRNSSCTTYNEMMALGSALGTFQYYNCTKVFVENYSLFCINKNLEKINLIQIYDVLR